ncbi:MAG: hypothetical protein KA270_03330 [Saprospiraceae bacterium]|nr:hypothetical protein [Saprospiraceae bacterium]MBP6566171.1 hypothetical protein [Saprospiraceae bacterium]
MIIFVPLVGSLVYLYLNFYKKSLIDDLSDGFRGIVNSNYQVEKLEKETKFTDTMSNKKYLAIQYLNKGRTNEAIDLLNSCLVGIHADDQEINRLLLQAYYSQKEYGKCIAAGEKIKNDYTFANAEEKALLAWAYYYSGDSDKAESIFKSQDGLFSNYFQRLEYSKYLQHIGRATEAKKKLAVMIEEIEHMDKYEKKLKSKIYNEIKTCINALK